MQIWSWPHWTQVNVTARKQVLAKRRRKRTQVFNLSLIALLFGQDLRLNSENETQCYKNKQTENTKFATQHHCWWSCHSRYTFVFSKLSHANICTRVLATLGGHAQYFRRSIAWRTVSAVKEPVLTSGIFPPSSTSFSIEFAAESAKLSKSCRSFSRDSHAIFTLK